MPTLPHSQNDSQEHQHQSGTRRKRKALSCLDCRRRKLKCDRVFPACSRCIKGGIADTCTYDLQGADDDQESQADEQRGDHDEQTSGSRTVPNMAALQRLEERSAQARRIQYLEQKLARMEAQMESSRGVSIYRESPDIGVRPNLVFQAEKNHGFGREAMQKEVMFLRGKGFKTQYYGSTKAAALLGQLPEVQNLMHSAFSHMPIMASIRRDFKALKLRNKEEALKDMREPNAKLLELLPDRKTVDQHVDVYFKSFETVYRILHRPSFNVEYTAFWNDTYNHDDTFIAILLLIVAAVRSECMEPGTYIYDSSAARESAAKIYRVCEAWVSRQSHKHISMAVFQVHYLLLLCKRINCIKEKRDWMATGVLLRLGMTSGLHRDPGKLAPKRYALTQTNHRDHPRKTVVMSVFEEEMRRRMWATAAEWELQASLERGMPAMMAGCPFDTEPPSNIFDEDLEEDVSELPQSRPASYWTPSFYQHHSHRSLRFRIALNSILNDPSSRLSFEDVLQYEAQIMQELNAIPTPKMPPTAIDTDDSVVNQESFDRKIIPSVALLDIQIRHYLIMLHSPFVSKSQYSAVASISAASHILDLHSKLHAAEVYVISMMRNDIFRASLAICHNLLLSNALYGEFLLASLTAPAGEKLSKALAMLKDQTLRLGTGIREYWVVSAANALAQARGDPPKLDKMIQTAVESVRGCLGRIVNNQETSYATPLSSGAPEPYVPTNGVMQPPQPFVAANPFDMTFPAGDLEIEPLDPTSLNEFSLDGFWQFDPLSF